MNLKNKKLLIMTSLITLLPIPVGLALWNRFPETMAIHFGITGQADGYTSPSIAVFVLPLLFLVFQWICFLATSLDKGNQNRNRKMQSLVLWIMPIIGNIGIFGIYALALDVKFSPVALSMVAMGLVFALLGNYMPKTKMNSTMGIKVYWTYTSEENWNATHRFAGKLWMAGGILIAMCFWLPNLWAMIVMFSVLAVITVLPILYSQQYYKKELDEGKELKKPMAVMDKKAKKISVIALILTIASILATLFYGDIHYIYSENRLLVDTNMYTDFTLQYDSIDDLEYREGNVPGLRVGGFGSFRLLMGFFENDEFGTYTRYTYYKPEACVVITTKGKTVVLSAKNAAETLDLYNNLLSKVG